MSETKPKYLEAAERLGAAHGMTGEEFLEKVHESIKNSTYPTKWCIEPDEAIYFQRLSQDRQATILAHCGECSACYAQLTMYQEKINK